MSGDSKTRVSLLLPVHNGESFLAEAIESVLSQTCESYELIISDDFSSDASWKLIQKYQSLDSRIWSIKQETNTGLFENYNACLRRATGEFIKPFAQDDVMCSDMLAQMLLRFETNNNLSLVSTARSFIDNKSRPANHVQFPLPEEYLKSVTDFHSLPGRVVAKASILPVVNFIGEPATVMFKREHAGSGFDVRFKHLGDLEYWFRILAQGDYCYLHEKLVSFRVHDRSASSTNSKFLLYLPDLLLLGRKHKGLLAENNFTQDEYINHVLEVAEADLSSRGVAFHKRLLDNEPIFLKQFQEHIAKLPNHGALLSAGFLELFMHSLAKSKIVEEQMNEKILDRSAVIRQLERGLRKHLSSNSWKATKILRDVNRILEPKSESFPPLEKSSSVGTKPFSELRHYELHLRVQLMKLRASRSWFITKPFREIKRWYTTGSVSADNKDSGRAAKNDSGKDDSSRDSSGKSELGTKISGKNNYVKKGAARFRANIRKMLLRKDRVGERGEQSNEMLTTENRTEGGAHSHASERQGGIGSRQSEPNVLSEVIAGSAYQPQTADICVIVATWNRAYIIHRALNSILAQTYENWHCYVVDDGSTDNTADILAEYAKFDSRITVIHQTHAGASVARNLALANSTEPVIAYLDSDNTWFPEYLATVRSAFDDNSSCDSFYTAQMVQDVVDAKQFSVRWQEFDRGQLETENFIDLNVFSHRRKLITEEEAFDQNLTRLIDWDLILRLTKLRQPGTSKYIGGIYYSDCDDSITRTIPLALRQLHIQKKHQLALASKEQQEKKLRVLYVIWHYPQITESYIETEIQGVLQLGVEVQVWTIDSNVATAYPTSVRIHRGTLEDAIAEFQPDILHSHWMHITREVDPILEKFRIPVTVRSHGFEFADSYGDLIAYLDQKQYIQRLYMFPHHAQMFSGRSDKILSLSASFNAEIYKASTFKNQREVLRVGAALPTKDYECYLQTAKLCPEHRFILVVGGVYTKEYYVNDIIEMNRSLGGPVEIRLNLQFKEVAELMRKAAIYMHTVLPEEPFGMPISIAEAMASGCALLLRRRSECYQYARDRARYYSSAENAAELINETLWWSDEDWSTVFQRSSQRAYSDFISTDVLKRLVADWTSIVGSEQIKHVPNQSGSEISSR